jgi:hypothetical protein
MNRILVNICVGAVSSIAGGTIVHFKEKDNIENLKKENEELEKLFNKYNNYIVKLKLYNNYYKMKYNDELTIVNGKVIPVESSESEEEFILKQEKYKFIYEGVQYEKMKKFDNNYDVYNLDDIHIGVLINDNIEWITNNFEIEHINHINYKHNLPRLVSSDSIDNLDDNLDDNLEINNVMNNIKNNLEKMLKE